jgi:hypothetical protein
MTIFWDAIDHLYKNRTIKADCLDEEGKRIGVTFAGVKQNLSNMRRQFQIEHLKVGRGIKI